MPKVSTERQCWLYRGVYGHILSAVQQNTFQRENVLTIQLHNWESLQTIQKNKNTFEFKLLWVFYLLCCFRFFLSNVENDLEEILQVDNQWLCLWWWKLKKKIQQFHWCTSLLLYRWWGKGLFFQSQMINTCCAVFMAKNWCCPSAPHTYPNALLSVTSLAMKEILFTTCSCSITWVTET